MLVDEIKIENFRGIRQGTLSALAPLSILVGPNNSGKSTVLESVWVSTGRGDIRRGVELLKRRAWLGLASLQYLFFGKKREAWFSITPNKRAGRDLTVQTSLKWPNSPPESLHKGSSTRSRRSR